MNKRFDCALVGAAVFNSDHFRAEAFKTVVAVDGGYESLGSIGVRPQFALGDFDSLGYVPSDVGTEVHPSMKDDSDTALALEWAHAHDCVSAAVYGALGGRMDHTMATIQAMVGFARKGMRVVAVGSDELVVVLSGSGWSELVLPQAAKGTVSVFSASDKAEGVCESGLKYEIENVALTNDVTLGLSNEFIGEESRISVENGELIIFLPLLPLSAL